jgi:hypothetical protein
VVVSTLFATLVAAVIADATADAVPAALGCHRLPSGPVVGKFAGHPGLWS